MTERITIDGLPKGTTAWIEKQAKADGFVKKTGKPNVSKYMRSVIECLKR
jgi:hypothetical protein